MKASNPQKTPPRGAGVACCVLGLVFTAVSIFSDESQFPSGRWPVFAFGVVFFLCGVAILRVVMFGRPVETPFASLIAVVVYWMFSGILFAVAFGEGELLDKHGSAARDQFAGRAFFGCFALFAAFGGTYFLFKFVRQCRNRHRSAVDDKSPGDSALEK